LLNSEGNDPLKTVAGLTVSYNEKTEVKDIKRNRMVYFDDSHFKQNTSFRFELFSGSLCLLSITSFQKAICNSLFLLLSLIWSFFGKSLSKTSAKNRVGLITIEKRFSEPHFSGHIFKALKYDRASETEVSHKTEQQRYGRNIPGQYDGKFGVVI